LSSQLLEQELVDHGESRLRAVRWHFVASAGHQREVPLFVGAQLAVPTGIGINNSSFSVQ
jgi:hypothetical protein